MAGRLLRVRDTVRKHGRPQNPRTLALSSWSRQRLFVGETDENKGPQIIRFMKTVDNSTVKLSLFFIRLASPSRVRHARRDLKKVQPESRWFGPIPARSTSLAAGNVTTLLLPQERGAIAAPAVTVLAMFLYCCFYKRSSSVNAGCTRPRQCPDVLSRPSDMAGATSRSESLNFQFLLTAISAMSKLHLGTSLPLG